MDSLFEAHEILTFLRNSALYSPRMIWRYTENPYEEICEIAVKLLLKITLFKDETLQKKIAEEELLPDIYKAAEVFFYCNSSRKIDSRYYILMTIIIY